MVSSDQVAAALADLVERSKTSGRPGADHELGEVLETALGRYELARLYLVATHRLGRSPIPEHPSEWLKHHPSRWTVRIEDSPAVGIIEGVLANEK